MSSCSAPGATQPLGGEGILESLRMRAQSFCGACVVEVFLDPVLKGAFVCACYGSFLIPQSESFSYFGFPSLSCRWSLFVTPFFSICVGCLRQCHALMLYFGYVVLHACQCWWSVVWQGHGLRLGRERAALVSAENEKAEKAWRVLRWRWKWAPLGAMQA